MCYTYIYPITDWGNHPGLAAITVVIGVVMLPICHMIWLGVYKLRTLIFEKTYFVHLVISGAPSHFRVSA